MGNTVADVEKDVFVGRSYRHLYLACHRQAAGHAEYLAGDEGGVVAGKETDGARQIGRFAEAAERDGAAEGFVQFLGIARAAKATLNPLRIVDSDAPTIWSDVRFWHLGDMSRCTAHVRFRG
jgi:hypothetical protein